MRSGGPGEAVCMRGALSRREITGTRAWPLTAHGSRERPGCFPGGSQRPMHVGAPVPAVATVAQSPASFLHAHCLHVPESCPLSGLSPRTLG